MSHIYECLTYQYEACHYTYLGISKKQLVGNFESFYESDDSQAVGGNLKLRVDNISNKYETIKNEVQMPKTYDDRW